MTFWAILTRSSGHSRSRARRRASLLISRLIFVRVFAEESTMKSWT